jgi:dynein heavy chain 1
MATAELIRSPSQTTPSNGIIPHDTPNPSINTTNGPIDQPPFDSSVFRSYLHALLPPVLGAAPSELESIFDDDEFDERVSRFAAEGGGVIYVVKVRDEVEGE